LDGTGGTPMADFAHLHVHSEYSLLDGAARVKDLARRAAELGMTSLALTDHDAMYGAIAFYKACVEHGVKPVIGCELHVTEEPLQNGRLRGEFRAHKLVLLARTMEGYRNLMRLSSIARMGGDPSRPAVTLDRLASHADGLIALSSGLAGEVPALLARGRRDEAKRAAGRYRDMFGGHFYLELQDHGLYEQKRVMGELIRLGGETGVPLVATNDVHYLDAADHELRDILLCIGTGKTVDDPERHAPATDQMYLKSGQEMARLFPYVPEAVRRTLDIAEQCEVRLEFGRQVLPKFAPLPEHLSAEQYLAELCRKGLEARYARTPEWKEEAFRRAARERLEYELSVIAGMGFSDYFLIVWDFIRFAHERGIRTGPGRGSSAGSLVAYTLNITDVDPIRYGLLFERFLNPERVSMPDIDIDFNDERRDEVIRYVADKYGRGHVAQIITFGTMAARAAVRDVGRALNVPFHEVDRAARQIPNQLGVTIDAALKDSAELRKMCADNPRLSRMIELARKVEGLPRHASTHAAGVVISREPLTHYTPLQEGAEQIPLTQYSMEHLESIGLLKMDFLGLRTLSIIERTLDWIEEQTGRRIDFRSVPDDDRETYALLSRGETTGVFQLESPGMRRVLKELKPSSFEDIISVLALYRPGPMEFIPKFVRAKHGQAQAEYPHPDLEPILKDTYGIIVYQEQIMQIASRMAGFSLGEADLLRRAVSKKKREVLDRERAHFVVGCIRQGYAAETANKVYDMIVRFADYGFPRAHATAYGVLAYQTAWLKTHYPAQFLASMLTSVMGSQRKVAEYADECRRRNIRVLPPDVNESEAVFVPVRDPDGGGWAIRFGLAAVKNVGTSAIESIVSARGEAPFDSLADFCRRVDLRQCNKRVIESLILAGALDALPGHRAQKVAMLDDCVEMAARWKQEREDLQLHLFGFTEQANWSVEMPDVAPYLPSRELEMEKELLGIYMSGHPLDPYEEQLEAFDTVPLHHLPEMAEASFVTVAGMVVSVKPIMSKKGRAMAFVELEDRVDKAEVVVFPDVWDEYAPLLQKGALVLMQARLQHQDERVSLLAERCYSFDNLPQRLPVAGRRPRPEPASVRGRQSPAGAVRTQRSANAPQRVFIRIAADREQPALLARLREQLKSPDGRLGVILVYEREHKTIALSDRYRVTPSPEWIRKIEAMMGEGSVRIR